MASAQWRSLLSRRVRPLASLIDYVGHTAAFDDGPMNVPATISMTLCVEKKPNEGEDAEPILSLTTNAALLAVFDGLGGAGGTRYNVNGTLRTGAYIAARLARAVAAEFFSDPVVHQRLASTLT